MGMTKVLAGVRVLDFGRYIAGPYCAALLADLGAEVIRIEKREGSEDRWMTPIMPGAKTTEREGAMFMQMNRNKRGMTLDPMKPDGRAIARKMVERADVVIANLPPETLSAMGLDYATLSAINPRIVLTTVSAFGHGGPYSNRVGFDGVAQTMSGMAYMTGTPEQPMRAAAPWVDFSTATFSAFGTLAALMARQQTGRGQQVEGALLATALTVMNATLIEQAALGINRVATLNRGQTAAPSDLFKCTDGWIICLVNGNPLYKRWARLMGEPMWLEDPRFATDELRGDNGEAVSARMSAWTKDKTVAEALAELEKARVPASPVYSPQQTLDDPHVQAMQFLQPVAYPGLPEPAPVARMPIKLSETPGTIERRAPLLGEHTDEIMAELGYGAAEIAAFRASGAI
jgi:crotonobetainyl-CoA:carnitine CoA-transferase CaiB-like acyl-CoA transferase